MGLERSGFTPALRLLNSEVEHSRILAQELVSLGGVRTIGHGLGDTGIQSIEVELARVWTPRLVRTQTAIENEWLKGRNLPSVDPVATPYAGPMSTAFQKAKAHFDGSMTFGEFQQRVGRALRRNETDAVRDAQTPFVESAAKHARGLLNELRDAGVDADIFGKAIRDQIAKLDNAIVAASGDPARVHLVKQLEARRDAAQKRLLEIQKHGPRSNTSSSFLPRYWLQSELLEREGEALMIFEAHFRRKLMPPDEARKAARDVYDTLIRSQPRPHIEDIADEIQRVSDPMSAMARTFDIPDELVESFLENDIGVILGHHVRTMSPHIEMTRRLGSSDLADHFDQVRADHQARIAAEPDGVKRKAMIRKMESEIEDLAALRDRLLGTYGASKDPHSWDSRTIRVLKNFTAWTTMGLSAISQMGDLFRPALTEGLDAVNRHGFGSLIDESRGLILAMARNERFLSGDGLELVMGVRSLMAADVGDIFMARTKWERGMSHATNATFIANGLRLVTDVTRDWASLINIGMMSEAMTSLARTGNLSDAMRVKLRAYGISDADQAAIGMLIETHGARFKSITLPNTESWGAANDRLVRVYRNALQQAQHRTVLTPGYGDLPLIASNQLAGLVLQYKTFGMSAITRTLVSGLQEGGYQFWSGAAVLAGGGILLNELRKQIFYDKTSLDQPYLGILADGIDRSGLIGTFTDVNSAVEVLSSGRLGVRPALGVDVPYADFNRKIGTILGPSAGQAGRALDVMSDVMSGNATARTWRQARGLFPWQNMWWADPAFDAAFPAYSRAGTTRTPKGGVSSPPPTE